MNTTSINHTIQHKSFYSELYLSFLNLFFVKFSIEYNTKEIRVGLKSVSHKNLRLLM